MKPTPRKLALAMSIAGLGASLGGGAHARSDGSDALRLAGLAATVGLPLPASDDGFSASVQVRVEGFPLALVAQPLDRILATADKGDAASPGRSPCAVAARGQLVPATARPRSLWGARRAAASMPLAAPIAPAALPAPTEVPAPGAIVGPLASRCTTAPTAETAAAPGASDGSTVRRPKARSAARPALATSAQRTAAAEATADRASATDRVLGELAQHLAGSAAGRSAARPAPALNAERADAADAPADRASAADKALGELAQHLAGIAAAAQVDIDLGEPHAASVPVPALSPALARTLAGAGAAHAVDLYLDLDIDPVTEPGTVASPQVLPDAPATAAAQVDIALDLDVDLHLYLQSVDTFGGDAGSAAAAVGGQSVAGPAIRAAGSMWADRAVGASNAVLDLELDLPAAPIGASQSPAGATAAETGRPASAAVAALDLGLAHGLPTAPAAGLDPNLDLPDLGLGRSAAASMSMAAPTAAALTAEPASGPVPVLAGTAPAVASASPDAAPLPVDSPVPPAYLQALGVPAAAPAGLPPVTTSPQPAALGELLALGESRLDEVRGGFQTSDGLQLSLGIERAVYINGNLVTTPSLNIVGIGTPPGAPTAVNVPAAGAAGVTLVQQGTGNTFLPGPLFPAAGTIIQNTLDGQTIRSVTSVNATVNSLEVMRARSFESSVRGMIIDSLRR